MARMIPESPAEGQSNAEHGSSSAFATRRATSSSRFTMSRGHPWRTPTGAGRGRLRPRPPRTRVARPRGQGRHHQLRRREGTWSTTRQGGRCAIKDPFNQATPELALARSASRARQARGRQSLLRPLRGRLPDTRVKTAASSLMLRARSSSTATTSGSFEKASPGVFRYWDGQDEASRSAPELDQIERVLANSFEVPRAARVELAEEERELLRLTEEQYDVLDMLERHTRAAIGGCAGSGKTFLAAEKARRLASQGFRVLVVCLQPLPRRAPSPRACRRSTGRRRLLFDGLCREVAEAGDRASAESRRRRQGEYWGGSRASSPSTSDVAAGRYGRADRRRGARTSARTGGSRSSSSSRTPTTRPLYVFFDDNQRHLSRPEGPARSRRALPANTSTAGTRRRSTSS